MDYELFVSELVKPLVLKPEEVSVEIISQNGRNYELQVLVSAEDLGRVIGRKGRIANSIRTIVHACAARNGDYVELSINEK
jgi:predicted RNA-binding protein YlqC (UPF0109 family)